MQLEQLVKKHSLTRKNSRQYLKKKLKQQQIELLQANSS